MPASMTPMVLAVRSRATSKMYIFPSHEEAANQLALGDQCSAEMVSVTWELMVTSSSGRSGGGIADAASNEEVFGL